MSSHSRSTRASVPIHITAYFDFMCPWSYLGRARLTHALKREHIHAEINWVPFELYAHNENHRVERERIIGHSRLNEAYAQLHPLGARENIQIFHPKYEASSKRALIGFLYAQHENKGEKYLDEVFAHAFEHTMDISSFAVLRRIAIKLHFDVEKFLLFIQDEKNHARVEELTRVAKLNGVRGVPTYLINHLPVTGVLPVEDLAHILRSTRQKITPAFLLPETKTKHAQRKRKQGKSPARKHPKKKANPRETKAKPVRRRAKKR